MTGPTPAARGQVHGVLVTYRRPEWLRASLEAVQQQTLVPDSLVVVDNDPGDEARRAVEAAGGTVPVHYLASPSNRGPAGGLADGVLHVLARADDDDWIVFLDDDDPPQSPDLVARLVGYAESLRASGVPVGGVGVSGSRLDRSSGRLVRPGDAELTGRVTLDYIGGNQLPTYSVAALRAVGPPDERLFFGFDDLEIGLRLVAGGFPLYSDGDLHRSARSAAGRLALDVAPSARYSGPPGWRRYYSLRNQVWILRQHGLGRQAATVALVQGVAKPVRNVASHPRWAWQHLRLNARAVRDGYRGRLGLTVPPA